jgi:hypothetical protein
MKPQSITAPGLETGRPRGKTYTGTGTAPACCYDDASTVRGKRKSCHSPGHLSGDLDVE